MSLLRSTRLLNHHARVLTAIPFPRASHNPSRHNNAFSTTTILTRPTPPTSTIARAPPPSAPHNNLTHQCDQPPPPTEASPARITYQGEIPYLNLTLPNGIETTFVIGTNKPISFLLAQILDEEAGVTECAAYELGGVGAEAEEASGTRRLVRWARSTTTSSILATAFLQSGFLLSINNTLHKVEVPTLESRLTTLKQHLAEIDKALVPLTARKLELDTKAHLSTKRLAWTGLGALCAQWGLMARLTWWEYSWDVMEPITYFMGAGTGILGYTFYVITSREYTYESLSALTITRHQYRLYKRADFNISAWERLDRERKGVVARMEGVRAEYGLGGWVDEVEEVEEEVKRKEEGEMGVEMGSDVEVREGLGKTGV